MTIASGHGIRIALLIAAIAGGVAAIWVWPAVWIPAVIVMIAAAIFLASSRIDREVRHETALPPLPRDTKEEVRNASRNRVGIRMIVTIGLAMLALSIVVSGLLFDWPYVAVGVLAILTLLLFFGLPVWVAAIQEEVNEEEDHLDGRSPPEP